MIKAIVFDLGGTLIEYTGEFDSWPELETPGFMAAYGYLKQQQIDLPAARPFCQAGFALLPKRWQRAMDGVENLTVASLLGSTLQELGYKPPVDALLVAAADRYEAALCAGARPIPYGKELLTDLKEQGYKLGLLSNTMFAGRSHLKDLRKFGLDGYFDTLLFSADENKWKPNAAPFWHILEQLDVEASAAVYIGDDPWADVKGGQAAGMHTVHFRSSQRFSAQPNEPAPDATIESLEQFPAVLHNLNGHNK